MGEAKKMNVTKDWYIQNLYKSQVYVAHSFWVICLNISRTIVELCMKTPYLCTVLAAGNQKKHLEFTFSIKDLSFHSRASIRAHKHIFSYLKWLNCWKSRGEGFFNEIAFLFCVTHSENSEVHIAIVSKWNMLRDWKLVQGFIFCLSSTLCKWEFLKPRYFDFTIWWRHREKHLLKSLNPAHSLSSCLPGTDHHNHLLASFQPLRELLIKLTLKTWSYILCVT